MPRLHRYSQGDSTMVCRIEAKVRMPVLKRAASSVTAATFRHCAQAIQHMCVGPPTECSWLLIFVAHDRYHVYDHIVGGRVRLPGEPGKADYFCDASQGVP